MIAIFYISEIIAILSTVCVILHYNPVRALLYLVVSFLSVSCIFFCLGAAFSGAIEIIIYAGAIVVLFIFVVMMLNTNTIVISTGDTKRQESRFLNPILGWGVVFLVGILFIILIYTIFEAQTYFVDIHKLSIDSKQIGITLFGSYILVVEIASFLLLSALISVFHLSQEHKSSEDCIASIKSQEYKT